MVLLEKLKEVGWYLTEEGVEKLSSINNLQTADVNKIISVALNWDLRDIAGGALPTKIDSNGTIRGRIILQIQKMRNISAPKANEESNAAPRFLQLELTDGVNSICALEIERIPNLNLNVPPGTKLFIKAEQVQLLNAFALLKPVDIEILGGKVEPLVEKWEFARQMLKYARSNRRLSGTGGPPPWIPFGKRLDALKDSLPIDRNFKSLQTANEKDKSSKENDEFNASRSQAIAEAAKAGQKKIFGGGQQNILDHNVKKILEKGYSEEEAKQVLKTTNNNLERALYNLKRRNNVRTGTLENIKPSASAGRIKDKTIASAKVEATAAKPQTNVSLFDFLTDKLPTAVSFSNVPHTEGETNNLGNERIAKDVNAETANNSKTENIGCNRFENNMSSSFAANRATSKSDGKQSNQTRSNTFNRKGDEIKHTANKNARGGERNNSIKTKTQAPNYNKFQNQAAITHANKTADGNTAKRNENPFRREREQTHRYAGSDYQTNRLPTDCNKVADKKSYVSRDVNRNRDSRSNTSNYPQKQPHKTNHSEKILENLVDATKKLTMENKTDLSPNTHQGGSRAHQQTSSGTNNQQTEAPTRLKKKENYPNNCQQKSSNYPDSSKFCQQNTKVENYSPQLGNGFAYDSNKIMGFQSKEANEYAMNMLKSQGMVIQQLQQQTVSSEAQAQLPPHSPQPHPQTSVFNKQQPTNVAYMTQNPNIFVASPQQPTSQISIMAGENWPWKEGDLCIAKYWDDGNYYNAKITAISDKTCVVLFLGYGNHEEVLKSDCVPIAEAQHIPINSYQTNINAVSVSQLPPPPIHQRPNMQSGVSSVGNQRYRGERQMYIPPPKRNNN